ncbi:MAG: hypothetical protein KGK18_19140 [Burkholderiales bacterium]|nr:hypothetical protein [Burkholderiales bacterium]
MTSESSADTATKPFVLDTASVLGRNKPLLLAALRQGGAVSATVTYTGVGDSGSVEDLHIETEQGPAFKTGTSVLVFIERSQYDDGTWHIDIVEESLTIDQALRDFAADAVDLLHGGWENGDGASGSVIFDVVNATVRVEHTAYFTNSDYDETTL